MDTRYYRCWAHNRLSGIGFDWGDVDGVVEVDSNGNQLVEKDDCKNIPVHMLHDEIWESTDGLLNVDNPPHEQYLYLAWARQVWAVRDFIGDRTWLEVPDMNSDYWDDPVEEDVAAELYVHNYVG